jgi:hypothetical protein
MHIEFILVIALLALALLNEWDKWKQKRARSGS